MQVCLLLGQPGSHQHSLPVAPNPSTNGAISSSLGSEGGLKGKPEGKALNLWLSSYYLFQISMDANQTETHRINEANCPLVTSTEESLSNTLEKGPQGIRHCRNYYSGSACGSSREEGKSGSEDSTEEDKQRKICPFKEQKENVVVVLQELNEFHSEILMDWRKVIREFACMLEIFPQGGDEDQTDPRKGTASSLLHVGLMHCIQSVHEDFKT